VVCRSVTLVSPTKTAEQIERCHLGCGLGWAQGIVLDGSPEVLCDVTMATSYVMQFTITGLMACSGL